MCVGLLLPINVFPRVWSEYCYVFANLFHYTVMRLTGNQLHDIILSRDNFMKLALVLLRHQEKANEFRF